jgi:hypothetical protein
MATILYKDFLIVVGADFERVTQNWVSIVSISWDDGGKREIHFLTQATERHDNADDAVGFGLALGKAWVEKRLTPSK